MILISIRLFQIHDDTQDKNTFKSFQVPIGNSKYVENFKFHNDSPILKYCQKSLNICCFSSLASYLVSTKKIMDANVISLRKVKLLSIKVGNCIDFANAILKSEKIIKGEPKVHYNLMKYEKKGY